jgi:hypothetical protein
MLTNEPHLPHLIDTSKKENGNLPVCFRHLGAENTRTPSTAIRPRVSYELIYWPEDQLLCDWERILQLEAVCIA